MAASARRGAGSASRRRSRTRWSRPALRRPPPSRGSSSSAVAARARCSPTPGDRRGRPRAGARGAPAAPRTKRPRPTGVLRGRCRSVRGRASAVVRARSRGCGSPWGRRLRPARSFSVPTPQTVRTAARLRHVDPARRPRRHPEGGPSHRQRMRAGSAARSPVQPGRAPRRSARRPQLTPDGPRRLPQAPAQEPQLPRVRVPRRRSTTRRQVLRLVRVGGARSR